MAVWLFWIVTGGIALAVGAILVMSLQRQRRQAEPAAASDLRVYRDQLAELERDLARGVVTAEEATRLRAEVSRRVLEADRQVQGGQMRGGTAVRATQPGLLPGAVLVLGVLAGSFGLYAELGRPGFPDYGLATRIRLADAARESRPPQAEAEARFAEVFPSQEPPAEPEFLELMDRLRAALVERPADLEGHLLLVRNEAALGNYAAAAAAQAQVIALKGTEATAEDHAIQAEMMIGAAGGYVSPEAETALTRALQLDPGHPTARYYSGLMLAQGGRADLAFRLWRPLLDEAPDAPWQEALRAEIEDMAARAGMGFALSSAAPGPTSADLDAAAEMSEADRQAMVEGMVAQLAERLATQGGPSEEWARLIAAHGVLGQAEQAAAVAAEARTVFAGQPDALARIEAAAAGGAP